MSFKYYGKSKEVCEQIIKRFEEGNLPAALAPIWVNRLDNIPSNGWSFLNRLCMAMSGTQDARGFKQWQAAGRKVSKGAKAFHILGPCFYPKEVTDEQTGETRKVQVLYGFKSIPVFRLEDTEVTDQALWDKCSGHDTDEENRLASLPYNEVARNWGLDINSYNGKGKGYYGYYSHGKGIAVGVQNLSTWAHELIHAADDRQGTLTKGFGQKSDNEIVAELGGAVLLEITGYHVESDLGGAWEYVKSYSEQGMRPAA